MMNWDIYWFFFMYRELCGQVSEWGNQWPKPLHFLLVCLCYCKVLHMPHRIKQIISTSVIPSLRANPGLPGNGNQDTTNAIHRTAHPTAERERERERQNKLWGSFRCQALSWRSCDEFRNESSGSTWWATPGNALSQPPAQMRPPLPDDDMLSSLNASLVWPLLSVMRKDGTCRF